MLQIDVRVKDWAKGGKQWQKVGCDTIRGACGLQPTRRNIVILYSTDPLMFTQMLVNTGKHW